IGFAAFIVLSVAQLYAFNQMSLLAGTTGGVRSMFVAITAGLFLVFTLVSLVRQSALMVLAYGGATRQGRRKAGQAATWAGVSILIPAFNEAGRIEKALEGVLNLDYPFVEAIVVDDGSTDETYARALPYAGKHGNKLIRVLKKPNGGKWSALNYAFHMAT